MKKIYLLMLFSMVTLSVTYAQTSDSPWAVSLGANLVGIQDDSVDSSMSLGIPTLSLSRYIAGGFSIGAQYSMNSIEVDNTDLDYSSIDAI